MAGRAIAAARGRDLSGLAAVGTGLASFLVYRVTLMPGLGSWDTAEAQAVPAVLGTMHPTGFPAWVVLGWLATHLLAPIGSPALVMNLLSAALVSVAVGASVVVMRRLDVPVVIAVAAAAGLALTPAVWRLATAADVHALHLALLAVTVALLLRWEAFAREAANAPAGSTDPGDQARRRRADRALVLTAAVFGVALADHALALMLIPAIGLFVLAVEPGVRRRPRVVLAAAGACLGVAALLYLELPLRAGQFRAPLVYGQPGTWAGFWDVLLARQFQGELGAPGGLVGGVEGLLGTLTDQLGPLIILVPSGLLATALRHPRYALLSGVAAGTTCVFAAFYENAAIERYYAGPMFFLWTWLGVLGAALATRVARNLSYRDVESTPDGAPATARSSPATRASVLVAAVAVAIALVAPTAIALPARWQSADASAQTWPTAWLDQAFGALAPDAVVLSWWSYSTPLWYGQAVEGRRPDVEVIDDQTRLDRGLGSIASVIDATIDHRPVYLIRVQESEIRALTDRFRIEPVGLPGNLYRVSGRKETSP